MTTARQDRNDDAIEDALLDAGDIDVDHIPIARSDLAVVELDGEAVIYDMASADSHLLNPVGTVMWKCFDGSGTIAEIGADLAEVFGIEAETAVAEVRVLAQTLGHKGLLDGVKRFRPAPRQPPAELPEGTELDPFVLPTVGGDDLSLADLKGQQTLLLNWSARCGYCDRIVPDLVAAQPGLADQGVRLALLSKGEPDEHQRYLDEGLTAPIALVGDDGPDLFPGVGTPAAYVLDASGSIASSLLVGALEVPRIVRELAGLPEPTEDTATEGAPDTATDDYDESEEEDEDDADLG